MFETRGNPATRRSFIRNCAAAAAALSCGAATPLAASLFSVRKCPPLSSGSLWWIAPDEFKETSLAAWRLELERQQALRFDLLWLCNVPSVAGGSGDTLRALLDLCAQRKVQVILDTGFSGNWYGTLDPKRELQVCRENIAKIAQLAGGHPAFYAWYVPHEIYMCWDRLDAYIQELYPALVQACKTAASLPVTVSPFFILDRTGVFGDFKFNEPSAYEEYWSALIKRSGFDIIMLQDSGEHFSYVTNAQRRPFFQAMQRACRRAGAKFWANVELAEMECPSLEEYVRRYGRVHHSAAQGIPWRPVPGDRLRGKLALAANYAGRIVSWGYKEYCRPELGPAARAWYDAYREYAARQAKG